MFKINNQKFAFADCVIDPQTNLLVRNSNQKRIEPKTMALLILLVEQKSTVISRQEIFDALWPSVVVGDEVISQLIYSLRNALGDDAKNPKYIETIPKKGYRFIGDVKLVQAVKDGSNDKDVSQATVKLNKYKIPVAFSVLLFTTIAAILLVNRIWLANSQTNHFTIGNILPVTQSNGVESDFAINNKTNEIIYAHTTENTVDLYRRALDKNQALRITNNDWREYSPTWLDDKVILYIREKGNEYQIVKHSLPHDIQVLYESTARIFSIAVTEYRPDEVIFIEFDDFQHNRFNELKSLNMSNGNVEFLHDQYLNLPKEVYLASFSQNGKTLYFVDHSKKSNVLSALQLKQNTIEQINSHFNAIEHVSQLDDSALLIAGTYGATKGIWQTDLLGTPPILLLPMSAGYKVTQAQLYNDNIYYNTYKAPINLSVAHTTHEVVNDLPKLNSEANEISAVFSSDGNIMYFASDRTGYYELWQYDFSTEQIAQITQIEASMIHRPIISSDESKLAMVYEKNTLTLGVFSIQNGKLLGKKSIPRMKYPLSWSKDDKNLYVSEHVRDVNIYHYDVSTLLPTLIQKKAGLFATESDDGQFLTLVDYKHHGVVQKNLNTGEEIKLNNNIDNLDYLVPGQLSVIGDTIFALKYEGEQRYLYQYPLSLDENAFSKNAVMALPASSFILDISSTDESASIASGQKIIFKRQAPSQGNIMLVTLQKN
ncbi:winged helix-turn-helix domain-containing protein [Agaribacter marinus]|uniref:OmpR/PhoB-type domain-containing protein n=1 Tax=Agaribacter marinus TaxID=1431249 RepID=A0AA37WJ44_9ALTE|nr:winged helix-turn-helix domain-containing protein [Agaribacter marinus]GLR72631.1 hypothetical protein GCM10007852_35390 [Agaribacter marinus]